MHYDGEKNLLFVSCRDGKFKCWKLPSSWDNPLIEQIKQEKILEEKMNMFTKGTLERKHDWEGNAF